MKNILHIFLWVKINWIHPIQWALKYAIQRSTKSSHVTETLFINFSFIATVYNLIIKRLTCCPCKPWGPLGPTGPLETNEKKSCIVFMTISWKVSKMLNQWGFPGGAVVENLPASAGDTGSSPGLGGSHMPRSNWAREPQLLNLRVWSLCSTTREAAIVRGPCTAMKSGPRSPQLEKALAQKQRPNTAKNKLINLKKKNKNKQKKLETGRL